jgi:hypothetical protein
LLLFCTSQVEKGVRKRACHKKYCDACLRRSYASWLQSATDNGHDTWQCPACTGHCTCAACQRRARKTGTTPTSATSSGNKLLPPPSPSQGPVVKSEGGRMSRPSSASNLSALTVPHGNSLSPPTTPNSATSRKRSGGTSSRRSSAGLPAGAAALLNPTTPSPAITITSSGNGGGGGGSRTPSPSSRPGPGGMNGAPLASSPLDWSAVLAQQRATQSPHVGSSSGSHAEVMGPPRGGHHHADHDHLPLPSINLTIVRQDTPDRIAGLSVLHVPPASPNHSLGPRSLSRSSSPIPGLEPHSPLHSAPTLKLTIGHGVEFGSNTTMPSSSSPSGVRHDTHNTSHTVTNNDITDEIAPSNVVVKIDNEAIDLTLDTDIHTSLPSSSFHLPSSSTSSFTASSTSSYAPDADPASTDSIRIRPPQRRRVDEPLTTLFDPPTEFDTGARKVGVAPPRPTRSRHVPVAAAVLAAATTRPPVPSWDTSMASPLLPQPVNVASTSTGAPLFNVSAMSPGTSAFMNTGLPNSPAFVFDLPVSPPLSAPLLPSLESSLTDPSSSHHNSTGAMKLELAPSLSSSVMTAVSSSGLINDAINNAHELVASNAFGKSSSFDRVRSGSSKGRSGGVSSYTSPVGHTGMLLTNSSNSGLAPRPIELGDTRGSSGSITMMDQSSIGLSNGSHGDNNNPLRQNGGQGVSGGVGRSYHLPPLTTQGSSSHVCSCPHLPYTPTIYARLISSLVEQLGLVAMDDQVEIDNDDEKQRTDHRFFSLPP